MTDDASAPYSTRMRVTMALARGIGAARGDADLTPVHVALALLREGENSAVSALYHAGVPLNKLRRELEIGLGERGSPRPEEVALPLTNGERELVAEARTQSRLRGDEHLGPHHLLLAVLRDAASPAAQIFFRHGFTHESALVHLRAVIVEHDHPHDHSSHAV
ncbi:MAG TPA: Clp protease N-terminal domain-containing protein [Anaerolineae bacterium]|nr:Clp protease N-terminal domain-containing protein [Anaerolineae bacterium]